MFRDVPACSGMFRVPGFIDGPFQWPKCETTSRIRRVSEMVVRSNDFDHLATVFRGTYCRSMLSRVKLTNAHTVHGRPTLFTVGPH